MQTVFKIYGNSLQSILTVKRLFSKIFAVTSATTPSGPILAEGKMVISQRRKNKQLSFDFYLFNAYI